MLVIHACKAKTITVETCLLQLLLKAATILLWPLVLVPGVVRNPGQEDLDKGCLYIYKTAGYNYINTFVCLQPRKGTMHAL